MARLRGVAGQAVTTFRKKCARTRKGLEVAGVTGIPCASNNKHLDLQVPLSAHIGVKGFSGALTNRPGDDPPPQKRTAAPADHRDGGIEETWKSYSDNIDTLMRRPSQLGRDAR
jgi:hypothetical protein